ncbi:MAG: tetratricopeptide (TPR) repeat protein [Kiritimatiellia bacterium]|jgi:tetratricopeptide (TPR) repeat protein
MKKPLTAALLIFLASPLGSVYGQSESPLDSLDELALSRALLNDQQDRLGALDFRLLEPLEQLADVLMQLNQFDEAHAMLDRAMQIARVEDGLYTEIQRPLLEKKIENFSNQGDWDSARENMEHLLWLYTNKSVQIDQVLIADLLELSRSHLRALAEDNSAWQGFHFRQSSRIRWLALGVAERLWSKTDERLVPIIYEQLRQFHLQTVALWRGGSTSYSLRQVAPGSGVIRDRSDVNESFYLTGMGLIGNMFSIYSDSESPNPEAIAMTNVYLADWHILFNNPQAATETYLQAYQELLASGVDAALANEFFSQPAVIPDTEFYASVEAAVAAQRNRMVTVGDENSDAYLSFSEWSAALPNVRSPIPGSATDSEVENLNFALFSFSLAGVNKVSRWYSHRFSSTVSTIQQAELLAHYLQSPSEESRLLEKLNSLTFRPKLVDGGPQQATGRIKYHFAIGDPSTFLSE